MAISLPFDFLFLDEAVGEGEAMLFPTSDILHASFYHTTYVGDHPYAISAAQSII